MIENGITEYRPIDKEKVKAQIYEIRGYKVMLDKDLAEYFCVETKAMNRAMKRNIKRFPKSFCFQLTRVEYREILRCQFGTLELKQGKYSKYPPFVYTEQGVAMLTSVLHTERAIFASVQIIEAFVEMSHYIRHNQQLLPYDELKSLELKHYQLSDKVHDIEENMITRTDLSELMRLFDTNIKNEEILILNGQPFKADLAYQRIFKKAKKSIVIIDDYLGIKTLHHLVHAKPNIDIKIISDNKSYNPLRLIEFNDFIKEYPEIQISFIKSMNMMHDRFIVIDSETKNMKVYLCGSSSKDSGNKITTIVELNEVNMYKDMINNLLTNETLILK